MQRAFSRAVSVALALAMPAIAGGHELDYGYHYETDLDYGYHYDVEDDYGYYDSDFAWDTDDDWYSDWYGDAAADWNAVVVYSLDADRQAGQQRAGRQEARKSRREAARDARDGKRRQHDRRRTGDRFRERQISGELIGYRTVNLERSRSEHVLAKVRTDQGKVAIMDLGTVSKLRDQQVNLERGMRISSRAGPARLNGKPIMVVSSFRLEDSGAQRSRQRDSRGKIRQGS